MVGNSHGGGLRSGLVVLAVACPLAASWPARAGSIFLTGHDPDFHAFVGGNTAGAIDINRTAIGYVTNPTYNPYNVAGAKFLFVESSISPPGGHIDGENGLIASGYVAGTDYVRVNASGLNAALNQLGTTYDAIVVASDFGGILTQAELNILDARSADIINFLNNGGGLYAMAESDSGAGLTPSGGFFGFLPFVVTSAQLNQSEVGNTVTPFGISLGLANTDVNGNASHNIFTSASGMNVVDNDSAGHILSLAVRSQITSGGVVPLPAAAWGGMLLMAGMVAAHFLKRNRRTA
ncbi:MAG: hypothetical protein ACHRHE_07375 [Tepidisphaerales bacterium]